MDYGHGLMGDKPMGGEVCRDFLAGRCFRARCRFVHPEGAGGMSADQAGGGMQARPSRFPLFAPPADAAGRALADPRLARAQICRDFENGRCFRPNCRYYHPSPEELAARQGQVSDRAVSPLRAARLHAH